MQHISPDTFLDTIFSRGTDDDTPLLAMVDNGKFKHTAWDSRVADKWLEPGEYITYVNTCTVKPVARGTFLSRASDNCIMCHVVVLDDVGSKVSRDGLPPAAYEIETSKGNWQFGYRVYTDNFAGVTALTHHLANTGRTDPGARGFNRLVRLPGSLHKTNFVARITAWTPDLVYTLDNLAQAFEYVVGVDTPATGGVVASNVLDYTREDDTMTAYLNYVDVGPVWDTIICPWCDEHTTGEDTARYSGLGKGEDGHGDRRGFKCFHGHCGDRTIVDLEKVATANGWTGDGDIGEDEYVSEKPTTYNDQSVLDEVIARWGGRMMYNHASQVWHHWGGDRWIVERKDEAMAKVLDVARGVANAVDKTIGTMALIGRVEKMARAVDVFAASGDEWNNNPDVLGVLDGVVDLRTGGFRRGEMSDMVSKSTNAHGKIQDAGGSRWLSFVDEITRSDKELAQYLQVLCGYMLTGRSSEQILPFLQGDGSNGKSLFVGTIMHVMGDYSRAAPEKLLSKKTFDTHTTDIAGLSGCRMIAVEEVPAGGWNESRLKSLTGDGTVSARLMRSDNVDFKADFKMLVVGNDKPPVDNTPSMRRRIKLIPFRLSVVKPDLELGDVLKAEADVVLRWMIDGAVLWYRNGLPDSEAVTVATDEYFNQGDTYALWTARCVADNADGMTSREDIRNSYDSVISVVGRPMIASDTTKLYTRLRQDGYQEKIVRGVRYFTGFNLVSKVHILERK